MKKILLFIVFLGGLLMGCNQEKSYYDQIVQNKTIAERIDELNKELSEIRKTEDKSALIKEEKNYLDYEYDIGIDETYNVTYFFDIAGCYEVGLDTYFNNGIDAQQVSDKIKEDIETVAGYKLKEDANQLYRWVSNDELVTIELDYKNVEKGMVSFTVFANE